MARGRLHEQLKEGHVKNWLIYGFLFWLSLPSVAIASPGAKDNDYVNPTYRHEGDGIGREPFAIACSSTSWTAVVAADETSRSVTFIALDTNALGVCVSTTTTGAVTCADTTAGYELFPGSSLTDYTTGAWNCRSRASDAGTDILKGARSTHSED